VKKLKVMLVDDEDLVIQDMITLIDWESHGYTVVACANDSKKALELFKIHLPDIMFVDIRIPQINGLELSRQLLLLKKNTKIHILTAYKDFDYAKTAIDIGVISYLLKHTINQHSLLEILNKAKENIVQEEQIKLNLKRQMILKIIDEGYSGTENNLYNINNFNSNYGNNLALIYLQHNKPYPLVEFDQRNIKLNMNEPYFEENILPADVTLIDAIEIKQGSVLVLMGFSCNPGPKEIEDSLNSISILLKKSLYERWGISFSSAYLKYSVQLSGLEHGYKLLKEAMNYKVFFEKDAVISVDRVISSSNVQSHEANKCLDDLYFQRDNWNYSKVVNVIEDVFNTNIDARDLNEFKDICYKLNMILTLLYNEKFLYTVEMCHDKWIVDKEYWYSAKGIKEWYIKEFNKVLLTPKEFKKQSPLIQNVLKYIHENYMNSINPNGIALTFGMNGTYLGQKFKKETGLTFLEYLTNHRVEVAKILLKSGKYKVYEVSEKVGYKTSQYFSSVFKEITGMTPLDFR